MKAFKVILIILLVIVVAIVLFLGYLGYVPGLSAIFGSNKPRDLGVSYTEADRSSARAKSQIEYKELPANTPAEQSLVRSGSRAVTANFSSAEITALMNNRPYKDWPYKDVQMKFNADGTVEVSGRLIKSRVAGYCASIGVSKEVAEKIVQYLPADPVYYVKSKAALSNNQVSVLEPSTVEIGRMSIPLNWILSINNRNNIAYAQGANGIKTELNNYNGKKAKIVEYINAHLAGISGFFAKSAYFEENKLHFEGNLNETEASVR